MKRFIPIFFVLLPILSSCEKLSMEQEEGSPYSFSISPTNMNIGTEAGSFTIYVKSNHEWTATIENSSKGVNGLQLGNSSGYGDGAVTVYYSVPRRDFYYAPGNKESGVVLFHHKGVYGKSQTTSCSVQRVRSY